MQASGISFEGLGDFVIDVMSSLGVHPIWKKPKPISIKLENFDQIFKLLGRFKDD